MEAITPFPQGRLRGRRDAVAATGKKAVLALQGGEDVNST